MWQVVDPASGALSVDQATDRSTPPRSSQWAVEKPWCQRHLPRRRKPQGCDPLADTEWCRNSGRNEIESGSRCRHCVRRSSAPHRAAPALSDKLRRNGKRYRCGAGTPDSGTGTPEPVHPWAITRSAAQWHCPVLSIDLLPPSFEIPLAGSLDCRRAASKETRFGQTSTDVGPVVACAKKDVRWAAPMTNLLSTSGPSHLPRRCRGQPGSCHRGRFSGQFSKLLGCEGPHGCRARIA